MKKMLLSVVTALTITASAFAATVGDNYQRVESTADLTIGAEYILCYQTNAMGAPYSTNKYFTRIANGVTLSSDNKTATIENAGVFPITIVSGSETNTYAFSYLKDNSTVYVTCTSTSNNSLNVSASLAETSNLTITVENGEATIKPVKNSVYTDKNGKTTYNEIQYNASNGQERFSNYQKAGQKKCTLYKKVTEPVEETKVATPSFSPAEGAVEAGIKVKISCSTADASIYYTIDGTTPTAESTLYDASTGIIVNEAITIKAIAVKDGLEDSEIASATYTIKKPVVATPTFDPAPGAVAKGTEVTITCATEGATIMYQINDGDLIEYDGQPIIINEATTIGAWAEKEGMADSDVVTAEYTIKAEIPEANKASFDFTKMGLYDKDGNLIGMPASGQGLDLPTVTLANNHVFISFAQTGSEQKPRIFNSASSTSSGTTLRLYNGNTMTITATGGLKIESIEFTGSTLNVISTETGSYTNGVWTPSAARASNVESVVFKSSEKPTIKTINVVTSGVYDSVDDIVIDENAPVEYYNLQGVRVANPENGIYIRRQGSKVSKVLVK